MEFFLRTIFNPLPPFCVPKAPTFRRAVLIRCVVELCASAFATLEIASPTSARADDPVAAPAESDFRVAIYDDEKSAVFGTTLDAPTKLVIPAEIGGVPVVRIADDAFRDRSSPTSVVISKNVAKIGDRAFSGCASLTSVSIPESVREIGGSAFSDRSSLPRIEVAEGNPNYRSVEGALTTKDGVTLLRGAVRSDGSGVIPDGVQEIGASAFSGCSSLASVSIPKSVEKIGASAFRDRSSPTSVSIPDGVLQKIGDNAFSGCSSLTSVAIPDGVEKIGVAAFSGCSSLASVVIPDGVKEIGEYAFYGCESLASVSIPATVEEIGDRAFSGRASDLTIRGVPGSAAERFANRWGFRFEPLDAE